MSKLRVCHKESFQKMQEKRLCTINRLLIMSANLSYEKIRARDFN